MSEQRTLQVLIATMKQNDYSLLDRMKLESDAIVVNQTNNYSTQFFKHKGYNIKWFNCQEIGVGLSRNTSLNRATADLVLFADDDVVYDKDYAKKIKDEFRENPDADIIIFDVPTTNDNRKRTTTIKKGKLNYFTLFKHGTYSIAARNKSIKYANLNFSLLFGGGAKYSAGEDSLFLNDAYKKGLKIYQTDIKIGRVSHESSTWFKGYNDKYFFDKGVFYYVMSPKLYILMILRFAILHRKMFKKEKTTVEAIKLMYKGAQSVKSKYEI